MRVRGNVIQIYIFGPINLVCGYSLEVHAPPSLKIFIPPNQLQHTIILPPSGVMTSTVNDALVANASSASLVFYDSPGKFL